ncbi:MAG: type II secretion system protein GspL [Rubrivivax sp.]
MSVLVILLPPRLREAADAGVDVDRSGDHAFVFSSDGQAITRQGRAATAELPKADTTCLALADADLSWQRLAVPKAPAARARAALGAMLEDALLDDDEAVHAALAPDLTPGQTGWVAVTDKARLQRALAALQGAGVAVDRVLPLSWPTPQPQAHVLPAEAEGDEPTLVWSHADGVSVLRAGSLARQQLAAADRGQIERSAHPAAVAAAERWLEGPVGVRTDAERALQASRSDWNLLQFDLAPRHRGLQAVREALRRLAGPEWRPVRIGAAALLALQVVGLNAWAWKLDRAVQDRRLAQTRLLQSVHPQVRSVLDAPLQMQRETEGLRAAAGQPGPADAEPLLAAAATAWPDGQPPLAALRFEPGRLLLTPVGWADAQHQQFAERVRAAGYVAERQGAQVAVLRGAR